MLGIFKVFLLSLSLFSAETSQLRQVLNKYQKAKMVQMETEKSVKLELLDKETVSSGKMYLSSKLFRWQIESPEKNLLVYDGKTLWNEQAPPEGFEGQPVQVSRVAIDKANKDHQMMLSLFEYDGLQKNFTMSIEKKMDKSVVVGMTAKKKTFAIKTMKMVLDMEKMLLNEVVYKDDIGNETRIKFSKVEFAKKSKPELFQYKPPKNAKVMSL